MKIKLARVFLLFAAVAAGVVCVSFEAGAKDGLTVGWAQLRPEKYYVFMRARAGADRKKTPYGLFAFERKSGRWVTVGTAADFGRGVEFEGDKIEPEEFFYSKQGYADIPFGNYLYKISWKDGRALISAESGSKTEHYRSPVVDASTPGKREYQFKHIAGGRLWFDMRVITDTSLYSEGVGYFDTTSKTFRIFDANSAGLRAKESIITRMTGIGKNVWLGVSFCSKESCLAEGALVEINDGLAKPVLYTSENSGIPAGAVLDVMPDGDALWVATSAGFSRWTPGGGKGDIYVMGVSLTVAASSAATGTVNAPYPVRLCAACGEAAVDILQAGDVVDITGMSGDGFTGVSRKRVTGWCRITGEKNGVRFDKASSTLIVPGGGSAVFLSEADANSKVMGTFPAGMRAAAFSVVESKDGWARVDLPGNVWVPVENAVLGVK